MTDRAAVARRRVLGDERPGAGLSDFPPAAALMEWAKDHVWEMWAREQLAIRDRCIVTVATLAMLNRPDFLAVHMRGALRNGVSRDELGEIVAHIAIYAGVVVANEAMRVFREVCDQLDRDEPDGRPAFPKHSSET